MFNAACLGWARPASGSVSSLDLERYTAPSDALFDAEFTEALKAVRPDWVDYAAQPLTLGAGSGIFS